MTTDHALRLVRDVVAGGARPPLAAAPRVLYVLEGDVTVRTPGGPVGATSGLRLLAGRAWHASGTIALAAAPPRATVLRYELVRGGHPPPNGDVVLEHAIELDPARAWLMRCDRVDFDPGGVALPHGHKGGGIRCLLAGALEVTVGDRPRRLMRPGDAWFESGQEPVLAKAAADAETSFIRVSILPREIRGASSIVYVDAADAARSRPRRYTVFVDEPIELPG